MKEKKLLKIKKDVEVIQRHARFVLIIEDADTVQIIRKEKYSLNVIAILGMDYEGLVLLEEIGLWRTKPFLASQPRKPGAKQNGTDKRIYVPARNKFFNLSNDQYELVAPIVFQLLQEIVNKQVPNWKHHVARLWCPCFFYTRRPRKLHFSWKLREWQRGLRFKVQKESFFARDVCWAELNSNYNIRAYLQGLANFIGLCLGEYEKGWKRRKSFHELAGVKRVKYVLERRSSLPRYLLHEVLNFLSPGTRAHFANEIRDLIGWGGEESEEKKISRDSLSDPASRLGDIQVRIIKNEDKILTFEVFPSS